MRSKRRPTITYRLHAQRAMLVPSIMLRRGYLEKVHLAQIQSEKDAILSHIGRLQPGVREEYLRHKEKLRMFNDWIASRYAKGSSVSDDKLTQKMVSRLEKIPYDDYDPDRLESGEHAEFLHARDAALTDRIPKKAVGL